MMVEWKEFSEAAPAFLTAVIMPFSYNVATGISIGFMFYVLIKVVQGKAKEIHPIMYIVVAVFAIKYLIDALQALQII